MFKYFVKSVGKRFYNLVIEKVLQAFRICRSLSEKSLSYDSAVTESTYKSGKTKFVWRFQFHFLKQLEIELIDWFRLERLAKRILHKEHGHGRFSGAE